MHSGSVCVLIALSMTCMSCFSYISFCNFLADLVFAIVQYSKR
jgi:hypothetical protein